jgi:UDP-glucose 4-epimerase
MTRCLVTGCAGFIGSHLVDRLLKNGNTVIGVDNLSTGRIEFLSSAMEIRDFSFYNIDLNDLDKIKTVFKDIDYVFHLAANADVRFGIERPRIDLEQNTIVTHNVLEAMRSNGVKKIIFSSTGSVYGQAQIIPTPEDAPFPVQTSLYGASKLAGEGLISAYCEGFNFQAWIFRFVSILGERYTHGHIFDFYKKLNTNNTLLEVLGNGRQRKSYLYVHDCIDAVLIAVKEAQHKVNIFNLGVDDYSDVNSSISWICRELNVSPKIKYSGGSSGWVGDNPFIYLDICQIKKLGWEPRFSIEDSVIKTVNYLKENNWLFEDKT